MNRLVILLLASVCIGVSSIHAHCEFETRLKDEFTGALKMETKPHALMSKFMTATYIDMCLGSLDDLLYLIIITKLSQIHTITEGSKIMLKMKGGAMITGIAIDEEIASVQPVIEQWQTSIRYRIISEDFAVLADQEIDKARVYYMDGYIDYDIKGKREKNAIQMAKCMVMANAE